jgi:hypothetical protein
LQGKRQYKTECYPPIDICNDHHLRPCQMIQYPKHMPNPKPNLPFCCAK